MAYTLLSIIQKFSVRTGLPSPLAVFTSLDLGVLQLMNLLEEECNDLAQRFAWQELVNEATWVSTAVEDQGAIGSRATNGFNYVIPKTFWDRTQRIQVTGPLSEQDWQYVKATSFTGPLYNYRLRGGHILFNPVPAAGHTLAFEYGSLNWSLSSTSVNQKAFTNDADTILVPEDLVLMGLRWRYKKEKKLAYAQDFDIYEDQVVNAMARNRSAGPLDMASGERDPRPGILVPPGSWFS